jgi:hypothetical protein
LITGLTRATRSSFRRLFSAGERGGAGMTRDQDEPGQFTGSERVFTPDLDPVMVSARFNGVPVTRFETGTFDFALKE